MDSYIKAYSYSLGFHSNTYVNKIGMSNVDQIGWKGAYYIDKNGTKQPVLVKLLIPKSSIRTKYVNSLEEKYAKHRCDCAKVLGFYSYYNGNELKNVKVAISFSDNDFYYRKNRYVRPVRKFSKEVLVCASGVHYFYSKTSAFVYMDYFSLSLTYNFKTRKRIIRKILTFFGKNRI